jgi:hypothetical protein
MRPDQGGVQRLGGGHGGRQGGRAQDPLSHSRQDAQLTQRWKALRDR